MRLHELSAAIAVWLICCVQNAAIAQTDSSRPPTPPPSTIHGSISGSTANPLADHPIARLFDQISDANPIGVELFGYLQQGVTLNPASPNDHSNGPVLNNYRSNAYQVNGLYLAATTADSSVTVYSLVLNQDFGQHWHYQLEHDLLVSDSRTGNTVDDFESYSIANYLFYTINPRWRLGLRQEWLRDDDGTLAGFAPTRPAAPGSFYNLTLGLNWHPREHLRIRPEIRHDWQVRDTNAILPAFNDGTSKNQWLFACDVLCEF